MSAPEPVHPGETLREDLEALGMSASDLARALRVPVNRITQILNGQRGITGDTALRLGRFFGTSAEFWMSLQSIYELRRAERKSGAEIARLPAGEGAQARGAQARGAQAREPSRKTDRRPDGNAELKKL